MSALVITKFAGDPLLWTAIPAPASGCSGASAVNGGAVNMLFRTDPNDANTEVTYGPNDGESVMPRGSFKIFQGGEAIIYFQPVSGTGPAVLHAII